MSNETIFDEKAGMFASCFDLVEGGQEIYDYNGTKWTVGKSLVNDQYVFRLPEQPYPLESIYIYIALKVPKSVTDPCAWVRECWTV